jgi:hypothetical protein
MRDVTEEQYRRRIADLQAETGPALVEDDSPTPLGRQHNSRRGEFTLFDEIEQAPRKTWQVEGFHGEGEMVCSFGSPSAGKSALIIDKSAHLADGRHWFGRRVTRCAVLHVAAERGAVVKRRYAAWRIHHRVEHPEDIPLAVLEGRVDLCNDNKDAQKVIDYCHKLEDARAFQVGFIPIETVNRVLVGGNENDPRDMGRLIDNVAFIQQVTGATIELVHHVPQGGVSRLRGHGSLLGALDVTLNVSGTGQRVRTCTVDKANDGIEGEQVSFAFISVELSRDQDGNVTTAPVIIPAEVETAAATKKGAKLGANEQTMLTILREAGNDGLTLEVWNMAAKAQGIGTRRAATLYDARMNLKNKRLVHCYGERWYVT